MTSRTVLTVDTIVDEALAVIRAEGADALSMRALASRMGVTAPAFYAHVGSRDELLRICAASGYARLADWFGRAEQPSAAARARAACRTYVAFASAEPELFSLMFRYRPGSIDVDVDNELAAATAVFDSMTANLAAAIDEGDLAPGDPTDYAVALWAAVHGVATVAGLMPGLDADELTSAVVDPMFRGWAP